MYIHIRAKTGQKNECVLKKNDTHFDISVKEESKMNMANKKIIELVARQFKIAANKVRIINGHHSPSKILSVDGDK